MFIVVWSVCLWRCKMSNVWPYFQSIIYNVLYFPQNFFNSKKEILQILWMCIAGYGQTFYSFTLSATFKMIGIRKTPKWSLKLLPPADGLQTVHPALGFRYRCTITRPLENSSSTLLLIPATLNKNTGPVFTFPNSSLCGFLNYATLHRLLFILQSGIQVLPADNAKKKS